MRTVIIYEWTDAESNEILYEGGIYENAAPANTEEIRLFLPLQVSGFTYKERKADLEEKAKEWQSSFYDFIGWSYGELAIIQSFFEVNGKRYGLIKEFRENGII